MDTEDAPPAQCLGHYSSGSNRNTGAILCAPGHAALLHSRNALTVKPGSSAATAGHPLRRS